MPLGDSGGRSSGNRTGEGARRRNTPRERAQIDPPWDQVVPRYPLTPRGQKLMTLAAVLSYVAFLALFLLVLGEWFGVWDKM